MNMNSKPDKFFVAIPAATDDKGYLGYLWKGMCYVDRHIVGVDFMPYITSEGVFYTPEEAKANIIEEFYKKTGNPDKS